VGTTSAREALEAVAGRQGGFFTSRQALDAGYSHQGQKYHADHGNWLRADRGIYRLPSPDTPPDDEYIRWDLWSRGRAVISHGTALTIHDLGTADPAEVCMTVPPGFRGAHPAARLFKRVLPEGDVEQRKGFRVTTVARTLLDEAADAATQEEVDLAVLDAVERGLVTERELLWRADELGDRAALRIERAFNDIKAGIP
jgi:predicted transcriptional regulator of viral defense system